MGGTDGRGLVAFDKKTGAEKWKALTISGDPGYGVPVIYPIGKDGRRVTIAEPEKTEKNVAGRT